MSLYENMMPEKPIAGRRGFYPVCTADEWEALPKVYKAMEWFPVEVYNTRWHKTETTVAEKVIFDVTFMRPYKIRARVEVHVQEVQSILFCLHDDPDCHLYSICAVKFANGEEWGAEWKQDTKTGAFAVYASGKLIGKQGGFVGFVPENIEKTETGWKWKGYGDYTGRCHYALSNPFKW